MSRGVVLKVWRVGVIVPLYKDKGERIVCKKYRGIGYDWAEYVD